MGGLVRRRRVVTTLAHGVVRQHQAQSGAFDHCGLVDLREIFHTYNLRNNPENKESGILTVDRVHLSAAGNQLVADKMLEVLLAK